MQSYKTNKYKRHQFKEKEKRKNNTTDISIHLKKLYYASHIRPWSFIENKIKEYILRRIELDKKKRKADVWPLQKLVTKTIRKTQLSFFTTS